MRNFSHSYALPGYAPVRANGSRQQTVAQGLVSVRHGTRRLSPQAHDPRTIGRGICVVLSAALFAWLNLVSPASRFAGCAALLGDVLPLQALESSLALAYSPGANGDGLAAARRMDPPSPCAISPTIG